MKQPKTMIFGARGMLGHVLTDVLQNEYNYTVYPLTRLDVDVTNFRKVSKYLNLLNPDIVINCTGILVRASEADPETAKIVNAEFPRFLAHYTAKKKKKLIHISTNSIFSGRKFSYYKRTDIPDAETVYGKTKAQGESYVLAYPNTLVLRTSIIGGELKNGTGLLHWVLTNTNQSIKGYTKVYWNGVTTLELSKLIAKIIPHDTMYGLYHVTGEDITKYQLIKIIKGMWKKQFLLQGDNSVQSSNLLEHDIFPIRPQFDMIADLFHYMQERRNKYTQYYY